MRLLLTVMQWCARMPLAGLHFLGAGLGWLVYVLSPTYARRCRTNLRASGICTNERMYRQTLRAAIAENGKSVTELCKVWFGRDDEIARLVSCDVWSVIEKAQRAGKGILFLTPHLGCFEISALYVAQRMPLTVLYRPPKRATLEPIMRAGRVRGQMHLAPANLTGVRMLYKALRRGEAIGVLPDQAPGVGEGKWAEFFGRPAYTMTLVTRLQAATGATVIMAFAERLSSGRGYRLHLEPVTAAPLLPGTLNHAVEATVRLNPAQYLWGYNRYKVPAGAEPPQDSKANAA